MKPVFLLFGIFFILACTHKNGQKYTAVTTPDTLCFLHTEGTSNQDSSRIQMIISGNRVTGTFNHIPFEKDARTGTINGSKKGNRITANWIFMQEGLADTLPAEFQLKDNILLQKPYSVDTKSGRQFISDTANYRIKYIETSCTGK